MEIPLELTGKLPFSWAVFKMLKKKMLFSEMGEKSHQWSYIALNSASYNTNLLGRMCTMVQKWHTCYRSNQQLSVFCGLLTGENSSLVLEICSTVHDYRLMEPRIKHTITTILILPSIHVAKLESKFHDYLYCS